MNDPVHGGKIQFEFCYIKFKFNFPAMQTKDFLTGFFKKIAFNFFSAIELLALKKGGVNTIVGLREQSYSGTMGQFLINKKLSFYFLDETGTPTGLPKCRTAARLNLSKVGFMVFIEIFFHILQSYIVYKQYLNSSIYSPSNNYIFEQICMQIANQH